MTVDSQERGNAMEYSTVIALVESLVVFPGLFVVTLTCVSIWHVFRKAGKPGWASVVPVYNAVVWLEIAGAPAWWLLLLFIPLVNVVVSILVNVRLSKKFGRSVAFGGVGLSFLPFVFFPILASPSAQYMHTEMEQLKRTRIHKLGILLSSLMIHIFVFLNPLWVLYDTWYRSTGYRREEREALVEMGVPVFPDWAYWSVDALYVFIFICAVFIWTYRKWAVYAGVCSYICIVVIYVTNGDPLILQFQTLFLIAFLVVGFLTGRGTFEDPEVRGIGNNR